jgi:hypothetical protein
MKKSSSACGIAKDIEAKSERSWPPDRRCTEDTKHTASHAWRMTID